MSRRDPTISDTPTSSEPTYSLGAVARLTGLSPHVLRAWERRYGAVKPLRTSGGTRRYRETDVARLRQLRSAVQAGHSISEVANASDGELERRLELAPDLPTPPLDPILDAIEQLDAPTTERLLSGLLAVLGPTRFVRTVATPLLHSIGSRWEVGQLSIASEHMASSILRHLLGTSLRPTSAALQSPPILFTTLPGEAHELGSLMAAVAAADAGGHPVFVGGNLPVGEIVDAAEAMGATAVAVGVCHVNGDDPETALEALRTALPLRVELWVGGPGSQALALPTQVSRIADTAELERKVALLRERGAAS
jgi:DNA-binding transcriptional MerR regulator